MHPNMQKGKMKTNQTSTPQWNLFRFLFTVKKTLTSCFVCSLPHVWNGIKTKLRGRNKHLAGGGVAVALLCLLSFGTRFLKTAEQAKEVIPRESTGRLEAPLSENSGRATFAQLGAFKFVYSKRSACLS